MKLQLSLVLQTILLVSSNQEEWRPLQGSHLRGGRGVRWHELERLAKVTRDTDARIVDWNRAGRTNQDQQYTNTLDDDNNQSPAYSFYPSRRETAARKKKKPTVQPTSTPRIESHTDRQTNKFQEKLTTKYYGTPTTTTKKQSTTAATLTESTPKPTKYHYYPHNQHIYLLPECAIQQVCNAIYVRLNYTQPLCACPSRKEPCSASLNTDDQHTTELATVNGGKVLTLVKTCEPVTEMRICRAPRDWSLLALQNIRTGKSHYLVICRCPDNSRLEGPMSHDQPAYASVPGIRVYGMMCVRDVYRKPPRSKRSTDRRPPLPWDKIREFKETVEW